MATTPIWMRPPKAITPADIDELIREQEPEHQWLEYKGPPGYSSSDKDKREISKDVSAMVNAGGGLILIGIDEDGDGRPTGCPGLEDPSPLLNRLDRVTACGIDPPVRGLDIREIEGPGGVRLVAIHCPRSAGVPHMVVTGGQHVFWSRRNRVTERMRRDEVRLQFLHAAALREQKATAWTRFIERVSTWKGESSVSLQLAITPVGATTVDISDTELHEILRHPTPQDPALMTHHFCGHKHHESNSVTPTLEGLLVRPDVASSHVFWNIELWRDGTIAAVIDEPELVHVDMDRVWMREGAVCKYPCALVEIASSVYAHLNVGGPYELRLRVVGVRRLTLRFGSERPGPRPPAWDTPAWEVATLDSPPAPFLAQIETVFNALGDFETPRYFDADGALGA